MKDAGSISPSPKLFVITYAHDHKTLKAGDIVAIVESPQGFNYLFRSDHTLHNLSDGHDQYVHLEELPNQ